VPNFAYLVKPVDLAIINSDLAKIAGTHLSLFFATDSAAGARAHITMVLTLQDSEFFKTELAVLFVLRRTNLAILLKNCRVQGVYLDILFSIVESRLLHPLYLCFVKGVRHPISDLSPKLVTTAAITYYAYAIEAVDLGLVVG